MILRIKDTQRH
eukprot:gene20948-27151_t